MSLEKLTIKYEPLPNDKLGGEIKALFNPGQVTFSNNVDWRPDKTAMDAKIAERRQLSLESIQPATLTLDLFFDTYEGDPQSRSLVAAASSALQSPIAFDPGASPAAVSVLKYTDAMAALTRHARELHRPPICTLSWGNWQLFEGVLSSLTREFTLFLEDGTPVRATVSCTFTEYIRLAASLKNEQNSPDVAKRYTVRPGDTLVNIAVAFYNDASVWRLLADENGLQNPRKLPPGLVLSLPPLKTEET